jgi:hypothetical protein
MFVCYRVIYPVCREFVKLSEAFRRRAKGKLAEIIGTVKITLSRITR